MDDKKIAFIICQNDEQDLLECCYYLNNLYIPEGYEIDIITIGEAPSMAAGYNAGMNSSDARYKVYLHQDVFIINQNFMIEMLQVFLSDPEIGLMGCIGCRQLPQDAYAVTSWDTGKVKHNDAIAFMDLYESGNCEVDAVDGMLMATQYDLPWREDLFDGWDFYDISQCYEFHRYGKKVVVPEQKEVYCYHDNRYSKMLLYDKYRKRFINEYSDIACFEMKEKNEHVDELERLKIESVDLIKKLFDNGKYEEVCEIFRSQNEGYLCLRELEILSNIYAAEKSAVNIKRFVADNETSESLLFKLEYLKHLMIRMQYCKQDTESALKEIIHHYSMFAVAIVCMKYKILDLSTINYIEDFCLKENISHYQVISKIKMLLMKRNSTYSNSYITEIFTERRNQKRIIFIIDQLSNNKQINTYEACNRWRTIFDIDIIVREFNRNTDKKYFMSGISIYQSSSSHHLLWSKQKDIYKEVAFVIVVGVENESYIRLFYGTNIPVYSYFDERNNYELYETLGNKYRETNVNQAFLCYEHALFLAKNESGRQRQRISKIIKELRESCDFCVQKVSIVILSYNNKEITRECVESIRQTMNPDSYELILVDNASTDGAKEWLMTQTDMKLILNKENKGFPYGCNQGIAEAEAAYDIFLLNNDTIIPEHAIFWLRMGLYEESAVGATGSISNNAVNYQQVAEQFETQAEWMEYARMRNQPMNYPYEKKGWLMGFALLIKRAALEKVMISDSEVLDTRFSPGNYEDNDLCIRLLRSGFHLLLCRNSFIYHYGSKSFQKAKKEYLTVLEVNRFKLQEKYGLDLVPYGCVESAVIDAIKPQVTDFKLLEIGCKLGATLARIQVNYPEAKLLGIEKNPALADLASHVADVSCADFMDIVMEEKVDYILMDGLIKDKKNSIQLLKKAKKSLGNTGVIILSVNNSQCLKMADKKGVSLEDLITICKECELEIKEISHRNARFSEAEIKELDLEQNTLLTAEKFILEVK